MAGKEMLEILSINQRTPTNQPTNQPIKFGNINQPNSKGFPKKIDAGTDPIDSDMGPCRDVPFPRGLRGWHERINGGEAFPQRQDSIARRVEWKVEKP